MKNSLKNIMKKTAAYLLSGSMILGLLPSAGVAVSAAETAEGNSSGVYLNHQGELEATEFIQLPVGAVKPENWLENQMLLMKNGITGLMKEHINYNVSTSEWLNHTSGDAWEKGPYFARGLTAMAYVLDDDELLDEALLWVAAVIDSQQENGYFGPKSNADWWARMPALDMIRDFYEGVERKEEADRTEKEKEYFAKVIPFFEKYFRYQLEKLPSDPLDAMWGAARAGDNIEIVYWLYDRQYDENAPENTRWLLDLAEILWSQSVPWDQESHNTTVRHHVVNTSQGMKTAPLYSLYDQDNESLKTAFAAAYDNIAIDHGRVDGLSNSDELPKENRADRGTELCGVAEAIVSTGIAMEVSGEVWMGDWLESLAYNSLPAAYSPDYSGQSYFVQQNQVTATSGTHGFNNDDGNRTGYSAPGGFECCFPNNTMAWAKFVQNMWMATETGGLAVTAYGPNYVTADVAGGKTAVFEQKTDYPFRDTVQLVYAGDSAEFDLRLRIPEWAKGVTVKVNGKSYTDITNGEFYKIIRKWENGDKIDITFESEVELSRWYNNSTSVKKGALIYSLKIEEDWRTDESSDISGVVPTEEQPQREVYPASAWNYGLVTDKNAVFKVTENEMQLQPFTVNTAPVSIQAKGVLLENWGMDGKNAQAQPYGPIRYENAEMKDITLIPYACGRLHVSQIPTMNNEESTESVIRETGNTIKRNGVDYQEFDNLVVPKAKDYTLKVTAKGSGTMTINSKYTQKIDGNTVVEHLKSLPGLDGYFQFKEGQFNNIRFSGDIKVSKVEVESVEKTIEDIHVITSSRKGSYAKIVTNLDAQETPYQVSYGTQSGKYTHSADSFKTGTATLYNLDPEETYYAVVEATVNGKRVTSSEIVLSLSEDELSPNPNSPSAEYEGFTDKSEVEADWEMYDPQKKIQVQEGSDGTKIRMERGTDMKAVLERKGSEYWTDYVAEAKITLDNGQTNNAGLMFRSTDNKAGADGFRGYYFGIGAGGVTLGYGNGYNFTWLESIPKTISANQEYTLKAVVYDDLIACYLNDELVTVRRDSVYSNGTVGVRSYDEAFTVHNVTVRNLKKEDLKVFENVVNQGGVPSFTEDFEEISEWSLFGDTESIHHQNGELQFAFSDNVKAVAGDENWTDMVVLADIRLGTGDTMGNAGVMFRAKNVGDGADGYQGYYFGISGKEFSFGKADGGWTLLKSGAVDLDDSVHRLKVVASGNTFLCYIDEEQVAVIQDTQYTAGRIGVRSYRQEFAVDNLEVRGLNAKEKAEVEKTKEVNQFTISAVSSYETIVVKHPVGNTGADKFRIVYGTKSGDYTYSVEDIAYYGWTQVDKTAVTVPNETIYLKMYMMKGNEIIAASNELKITANHREDTAGANGKMTAKLNEALKCETSDFTSVSKKRLEQAIAYAQALSEKEGVNQVEYGLAEDLLSVALHTRDTEYVSLREDPTPTPVNLPYVDVEKDGWYYDAVVYNYEKKTMTGLDDTHFGPADTLVRAQFAAVLHKMNKEVEMEYTDIFADVTEPDWFKDAVLWAAEKKIVTGYTGTKMFGPNDPVTRAQMATMMYRYAKDYKGYDVKVDGDYSAFPDAGDVQEFAIDAMKWAVSEGIITGKTIDGKLLLDPQGSANRAECATIIQRFMEKYEK